jgi:hypothetical protein
MPLSGKNGRAEQCTQAWCALVTLQTARAVFGTVQHQIFLTPSLLSSAPHIMVTVIVFLTPSSLSTPRTTFTVVYSSHHGCRHLLLTPCSLSCHPDTMFTVVYSSHHGYCLLLTAWLLSTPHSMVTVYSSLYSYFLLTSWLLSTLHCMVTFYSSHHGYCLLLTAWLLSTHIMVVSTPHCMVTFYSSHHGYCLLLTSWLLSNLHCIVTF